MPTSWHGAVPDSKRGRSIGAMRVGSTYERASANPTRPLHVFELRHPEDVILAKRFIKENHYAGRAPSGKNIYFGGYVFGSLYCVATYGPPKADMRPGRLLRERGFPVTRENLFELTRLCRVGGKGRQEGYPPLSKFLSVCHRILKRKYGIRFIQTFSDPMHDHDGRLYKAANFEYLGKTTEGSHVIDFKSLNATRRDKLVPLDGPAKPLRKMAERLGINEKELIKFVRHRRVAYKYMCAHNEKKFGIEKPEGGWFKYPGAMTIAEARTCLGFVPVITEPKHRWLLNLGG